MASENPQLQSRFRNHSLANTAAPNFRPATSTFRRDAVDPQVTPRTGKGTSPLLLLLLVLAAAVALFGAGNLPQLNSIFDSLTNSLHSHNDAAAGSIMSSGEIILIAGVVILVAIILLLWRNTARRKQSR
jgi:hypothetical protein